MKMKKGLLTMLALLSIGSVFAQDYSVPDARVVTSRQGVLKVQLSSTTPYRDLQFDLTLPTGISLVTESVSPDSPDATNVKEAATGHVIAYNPVGDNAVRFAVYDQANGNTFSDGVLIEIPVQASDAFTADAVANVTNLVTSDAEAKSYAKDSFNFNIKLNLLGDVDENDRVEVTDILLTADYILNEFVAPNNFKNIGAANVENNNIINVTDILGIADIILSGSGSSSAKEMKKEEVSFVDTLDPQ
jgi:hypothetical protein